MEQQILIDVRKLNLYRWGTWFLLFFAMFVNGISLFIVHLLTEPHVDSFGEVVSALIDYPAMLKPMFLSSSKFSSYLLTGIWTNIIIVIVIGLTGFFMVFSEKNRKIGNY